MQSLTLNFSHAGRFCSDITTTNHSHAGSELVYVTSGKCRTDFPEYSFEAEPGQLYVIAPNTPHVQINDGMVETLYAVFGATPEFFDSRTRLIDLKKDMYVKGWLQQMVQLCHESCFEQCEGLLISILQRIKEVERLEGELRGLSPKLIDAMHFINDNLLNLALDLEKISNAVCLSTSSLKSHFHRELNTSPMRHVQKLKIERAKQLLRNPYLNIGEVAQSCGYPDQNYFARIFRKVTEKTPSEFRREISLENRTMPEQL